jgi:hypothetical protein
MNSRRFRLRSALAVIMTVLVLVPTAILFGRVWQDNSDRHASTAREQNGVEYLTALAPLINSLVEYESSAVQGVADAPDSLKTAIAKVTDVDNRLGDDLKTRDRWTGLQDKISKLAKVPGGQLAVFQAHSEVLDLTVALYDTVRRNSELNRDPDNDLSNLQQAVAVDMPSAVQHTNEMGDLANIQQTHKGAITVQFGEAVLAVQNAVGNLTDDLQAAVEDTKSQTLSGSLVTTLDQFRRGIESMNRGANIGGDPNIATIAVAQSSLQTALNSLAGVTLREMGKLLDDRQSTINYRRTEAIVLGLIAVALVLGALIWPATVRRRETASAPVAQPTGDTTRDIVAASRPAGYGPGAGAGLPSAGSVPGGTPGPYDQLPAYGDGNPTRRERSGAVR